LKGKRETENQVPREKIPANAREAQRQQLP